MKNKKKYKVLLWIGIILIFLSSAFFAERGYFYINLSEIIKENIGDFGKISGELRIVNHIRVPRILVGVLAGGILSITGVVFQGILFNPLADSYTLGIASGASFGAALSIFLGVNTLFGGALTVWAFSFGVLSLFIVLYISKKDEVISSNTLILSGVITSAFFSSGVSLLQYLKGSEVNEIIFWIMGSFSSKTWSDVWILLVAGIVGIIFIMRRSDELNIISLGDRIGRSTGVDVKKEKKILLIVASILSGVVVSITGVIGFVGLMIPHLVRGVVGSDNKKVVPLSFLYGGLLTMVADNIVRIYFPSEVPVGVLTALFGAPFFIITFKRDIRGGK